MSLHCCDCQEKAREKYSLLCKISKVVVPNLGVGTSQRGKKISLRGFEMRRFIESGSRKKYFCYKSYFLFFPLFQHFASVLVKYCIMSPFQPSNKTITL